MTKLCDSIVYIVPGNQLKVIQNPQLIHLLDNTTTHTNPPIVPIDETPYLNQFSGILSLFHTQIKYLLIYRQLHQCPSLISATNSQSSQVFKSTRLDQIIGSISIAYVGQMVYQVDSRELPKGDDSTLDFVLC